ncbi:hypothetical protein HN014_10655 [Aquimarina sp. TRL1]|uniref:DUF4760 domain-containing protein n=1 Tax=Aquimarina sp. (strain TRL1) TaxID=2736252 RepID=UPI00158E2DD0|nr:hypothetical protein [Aquimarina sp. TRL1]QKX05355.1 hypothetical protein HN014_10655 [Aquimarina sp. TRL1]
MEIFDQSKSLIENLSHLSSTIVGIVSLIIIWQLIVAVKSLKTAKNSLQQAKDEFTISSKRYSAHEAAKLCEKFTDITFRKINEFERNNVELVKQYPKVLEPIKSWDSSSKIIVANPKETIESVDKIFNANSEFFLNILNEFEVFAMHFTKQIADEDIAFQTVGKTFLDYVENFHPIILIINSGQKGTAFRNIRELYGMWQNKTKRQTLTQLSEKVKEELEKTVEKKVRPFGT